MEVWHIIPVNDLEEHLEETNMDECIMINGELVGDLKCKCKCNAAIKFEGDAAIIVHNAYDGREVFETDNEAYIFKTPPSLN
jgi:hypothetical protein